MKFALAILLLAGVVGIGVFGFMGMDHKDGFHMGCTAQTGGIDCANQLKTFSLAVFATIAFVLCISFGATIRRSILAFRCAFFAKSSEFFKSFFFPIQQELMHWLAFHKNSPALL